MNERTIKNIVERTLSDIPIRSLKGVGPRVMDHLSRLSVYTVEDLLFHLPLRYQDRTRISPIGSLRAGDQILIEGTIELGNVVFRGRRNLLCRVTDGTGNILLRFFHFTREQQQRLTTPGVALRCFGTVRSNYQGGLEIIHPEYRQLNAAVELPLEDCLTPIYPTTKGLQQIALRKLMDQALSLLEQAKLIELLPEKLLTQFQLPSLRSALYYVHRPPPKASTELLQSGQHPAQQRLAFEELVAHQLGLRRLRDRVKHQAAPVLVSNNSKIKLQQQLINALPFQLTNAQLRVIAEIHQDLEKPHPMLRLVQGDVGSGKTIVAMMAILAAIEAGCQAAIMAPTELLAEQHLQSFKNGLMPLGIRVGWLTGSQTRRERQPVLEKLKLGEIQVVIGTHALFQKDVLFYNLALIVVDEQHRFGVNQRLALKNKGIFDGCHPHQLIMTATPIPRTLAMTAYADLDVSVIDELPPGRKPVTTLLVSNERRNIIVERIRQSCQSQRQAYWVCTLVEDSEVLQCEAAEATCEKLKKALPNIRIGLVHGRIKAQEKEITMSAFKAGEIDLLVATTVIEVGVDVPNASLMVIENPERLGLSQLHQLRGRIGRGTLASHCVLLYQKPLSKTARQRLAILRRTNDGFVIAQEDLLLRGPGEVLGTRQAGLLQLQVADLLRDKKLLPAVREAGDLIVQQYPGRVHPLMRRWLVDTEQYFSV